MTVEEITRDDACRTIVDAHTHGRAWEIKRIKAALQIRCTGILIEGRCGLNAGHIGGCSPKHGTVTVSMARLKEILNG